MRLRPADGRVGRRARHRQNRTFLPPADECPLCPPAGGGAAREVPAADYDVVVFENRFPLARARRARTRRRGPREPLWPTRPAAGRCEVMCFTSDHDATLAQLPPSRVRTVVEAWVDRTVELGRAARRRAGLLLREPRARRSASRCTTRTARSTPTPTSRRARGACSARPARTASDRRACSARRARRRAGRRLADRRCEPSTGWRTRRSPRAGPSRCTSPRTGTSPTCRRSRTRSARTSRRSTRRCCAGSTGSSSAPRSTRPAALHLRLAPGAGPRGPGRLAPHLQISSVLRAPGQAEVPRRLRVRRRAAGSATSTPERSRRVCGTWPRHEHRWADASPGTVAEPFRDAFGDEPPGSGRHRGGSTSSGSTPTTTTALPADRDTAPHLGGRGAPTGRQVRIVSLQVPGERTIALDGLSTAPRRAGRPMPSESCGRSSRPVIGWAVWTSWSTDGVPLGSGLSSSAALECAVATAAVDLFGLEDYLGEGDAARWRRCASGRRTRWRARRPEAWTRRPPCWPGPATRSCSTSTATSRPEHVPFDLVAHGLCVLVMDTRAEHSLDDGQYGNRRDECAAAADQLGVGSLRDVGIDDLEAALGRLSSDVQRRRVRHVVTEVDRVTRTVAALEADELDGLTDLFDQSHASMRDDFEISCPELDCAVDTAPGHGALAARMTGWRVRAARPSPSSAPPTPRRSRLRSGRPSPTGASATRSASRDCRRPCEAER